MDISNDDKLVRLHTRKPGYGCERETLSEKLNLLIAAQNNAIKINYTKAKIDKMQQNCKWRLYEECDETVNHIVSECS